MSQSAAERLNAYLAQLPPKARALLMREFERSLERGENASVANFVLGELRKIVRTDDDDAPARFNDTQRLVFQPLEPFLVAGHAPVGPGQIRRSSLPPIWTWLTREGAPAAAQALSDALDSPDEPVAAVHAFRRDAIAAMMALMAEPDQRRAAARIGPASALEDLTNITVVLASADTLDVFAGRLPSHYRTFGESQIASVATALAMADMQRPQLIPFAMRLVTPRLPAFWQIVRLAIHGAQTDDAARVAAHPLGVAVPIVIDDLLQIAVRLRDDVKHGELERAGDHLKTLHDGVRGLRTELDIRSDSAWGRSLAMLRVDISTTLKTVIDNVPGRVRRLLRQRSDKEAMTGIRLDPSEVEETAALIDFVAICRSFASELAINEVTLRTYSDLQSYVEKSTEILVDSLRNCEPGVRGFRDQQTRAAIRFCEVLYGPDYAVLMARSADNALAGERKPAKTG